MHVAVVGHVEWVDFARVPHVPSSGEIVHSTEWWQEAGGGGAVAAVQLAKLAGSCTFFTALGDDGLGRRAAREVEAMGVRVEAAWVDPPQRRAVTFVEPAGERTITTLGDKHAPEGGHELPWSELSGYDAVYFVSGDAAALRAARAARVLTATSRVLETLAGAGVGLDAVIGSARDEGERYPPGSVEPQPALVVMTQGAGGGSYTGSEGRTGSWEAAALPGTASDAYGCGDSFAAGLTFALGRGDAVDAALSFAAGCGAACLSGRGPYEGQLRLAA